MEFFNSGIDVLQNPCYRAWCGTGYLGRNEGYGSDNLAANAQGS